ncbi:hypothetical protein HOF92_15435 [bacterium]|jgi:hypothetical protein|nr:hypothetical protein [bacterium]
MKKNILWFLLFLFGIFHQSFALGARARAMGGAFIGLADDENAIFMNPSGLSQLDKTHYHVDVLLNNRRDFTNDSFAYAAQIWEASPRKRFSLEEYLENEFQFNTSPKRSSRYNFAISVNRDMKSKDFIKRIMNDSQGNTQLGQMVAADTEQVSVNLGFATRFPMIPNLFQKNKVYGGVHLKYLQASRTLESLQMNNRKEVLNVGVSTLIETPNNLRFGAILDAAISEKLQGWAGTSGSSANLSVGGALRLDKASELTMDLSNVLNAPRASTPQFRVGFERELIRDELALRLGSWDGTFTMGFGMKLFEQMKIDYGFFNGDVLKEHYLSASLPF